MSHGIIAADHLIVLFYSATKNTSCKQYQTTLEPIPDIKEILAICNVLSRCIYDFVISSPNA